MSPEPRPEPECFISLRSGAETFCAPQNLSFATSFFRLLSSRSSAASRAPYGGHSPGLLSPLALEERMQQYDRALAALAGGRIVFGGASRAGGASRSGGFGFANGVPSPPGDSSIWIGSASSPLSIAVGFCG
jgi:hypothetical protein